MSATPRERWSITVAKTCFGQDSIGIKMEHEHFVLGLTQLPKVGRKSAWKIVRSVLIPPKSADEFFAAIRAVPATPKSTTRQHAQSAWEEAERILDDARKQMIIVMTAASDDFPGRLRRIPDPPIVLFVKGNPECIKRRESVAVIGTRDPSEFGKRVAHRFGQYGAEAGCVVVSGLAYGCDAAAHRGCLDVGGRAVAVLAHGLDRIYPKHSQSLAEEILSHGGCWVSEYAPGTRSQRRFFIDRDRLQSGIAGGVIVVETDVEGGTMHTVRFAENQGRPLAVLQHPPEHSATRKSGGNALLIREKRAKPLKEADDLCDFIVTVKNSARSDDDP